MRGKEVLKKILKPLTKYNLYPEEGRIFASLFLTPMGACFLYLGIVKNNPIAYIAAIPSLGIGTLAYAQILYDLIDYEEKIRNSKTYKS